MFQMGDGALELQLEHLSLCYSERKKYNLCMAYFSFGYIRRRQNTFPGAVFREKNTELESML